MLPPGSVETFYIRSPWPFQALCYFKHGRDTELYTGDDLLYTSLTHRSRPCYGQETTSPDVTSATAHPTVGPTSDPGVICPHLCTSSAPSEKQGEDF